MKAVSPVWCLNIHKHMLVFASGKCQNPDDASNVEKYLAVPFLQKFLPLWEQENAGGGGGGAEAWGFRLVEQRLAAVPMKLGNRTDLTCRP